MATSRYIEDVFVRHQVYLEGLKSDTVRDFDPFMEQLDEVVSVALARAGVANMNELSPTDLEALLAEVRVAEQTLFGDYARNLTVKLESIAEYEQEFAEQALDAAIEGAVINTATAGAGWLYAKTHPLQATGQMLEPFLEGMTEREIAAIEATLRNAHAQGWTLQETIAAIRGTKKANYTDGVFGRLMRDVESIVRTAIQHVSNAARMATFEANLDIVIGYRWVSTLDSHTTVICRSLDGQVFEIGNGPMPPIHIRCRSVTIPEMNETAKLLEAVTRAAKGGAVPANWTYYDWLQHQPASFQDSVLGTQRGMLFRNGGLSAKEFARLNLGRTFKPRTLDEMRRLRPEVFNRSGL
jgi:SPP1 gp7 family putative phage head morphogenesis protein